MALEGGFLALLQKALTSTSLESGAMENELLARLAAGLTSISSTGAITLSQPFTDPEGQVTITGDGAITIAGGTVLLTKGSAAAITLAAPTAAQAGTRITVIAQSAFAHVVTATALVDDGVTGGSKTTCTFGAFVGSSMVLEAVNLKWSVISKNVVTIT